MDYTRTPVTEAGLEPFDVVLNVVATSPEEGALVRLVRPGGVFVSTTTPAADDPGSTARTVRVFARSDREQLAHLVGLVDDGMLRLDVTARHPLAELAEVHALAGAGRLRGKVVVAVGG